MRIISRRTLREFGLLHPDAKLVLDAWLGATKQGRWTSPSELLASNRNVRLLRDNRAVFKLRGNHYRLVVKVNYTRSIVYVRSIGTHAEYDRIDANTI